MKNSKTKKLLSILLTMVMLVGLLPTAAIPVFAVEESDGDVIEVSSWSEFEEAFALSDYSGKSYTVKLMNDLHYDAADALRSATVLVEVDVNGCFVTLDFNGHTLSCTDDVSSTDLDSVLSDFIRINLHPIDHMNPIEFVLTDSVGGGGVSMDSYRAYDNQLAALHVVDTCNYISNLGYLQSTDWSCKLTINGGNYTLNAATEKFGNGTLDWNTWYRGTVISDMLYDTEINGGTFIANGEGFFSDYANADMCARELSAFATCSNENKNASGRMSGRTVINGGTFISNGYSIHHFDHSFYELGGTQWMLFPTINGGVFSGSVGFIGMTFTYSDGYEEYENKKATDIINNDAYVICIKDGEKYGLEDDLDLRDLHDATSLYVFSGSLFDFKTTPEGEGDPTMLTRSVKQSDTFEMSWTVPESLTSSVVCQPMITVTRPNSNIEPQTYAKSKITLDYSDYPNDVIVSCRLYVLVGGESVYFEQNYEVDVNRIYTATDGCIHCYAAGEDGWDEVVEGGSCSFKIYPKDYYELTDPDALEVYVNGDLVTPDGDGVYTVQNVTEDLDISCDGSGFTSYSNLTITANGKTVKEKILDGDTYTFKTLDEFGATVPSGSTFTGWKIGNTTYQPGETYTVPGGGEIAVNAAFTGLYNVTVENGKAYADEAHTQPITHAAEDQVIYIVADPAPEGKVFGYWTKTVAIVGGHGWFGDYSSAETTFTVYDTDVVLTPVYETIVDEVIINGLTKPVAGATVEDPDYAYKFGMSVPEDAGYAFSYAYLYDTTTDEDVFVSNGDLFQAGHSYRYDIRINSRVQLDYYFPDDIQDLFVILSGIDTQEYVMTLSYPSSSSLKVSVEFICEGTTEDVVSVSGSISSHGASSPVTIELWNVAGTSATYSTTISGDSTTYSIPDVVTGVYELIVLKAGHMPFRYTFVAKGEAVTQDAELNLYADTNLDGEIDESDYQALVNAVLQDDHEQIETAKYDDLIHYDIDGDGYLDVIDAAFMALIVNGHRTIEEVYDLKKGDYDYDGEAYTESDLIAMYHVLSDIDSSAPTLSTSQKFASDLNYNGKVDEEDLNKLVRIYGEIEETTCEENIKVYYRWGNSYTTCTATAICTICDKHVAKETVNSVKNADGSYTATFTNTLLGTKTYKK